MKGYSNAVPACIPSKRILEEGGYEGGGAMVCYDRSNGFASDVKSRMISAVHRPLLTGFAAADAAKNAAATAVPSPFIPGKPRPTLPADLYAVAGMPWTAFLANTILAKTLGRIRFEVECPIGTREGERRHIVPEAAKAGSHPFQFRLLDSLDRPVRPVLLHAAGHFTPAEAGSSESSCTVLVVGDSLTASDVYPEEIARLFAGPGNAPLRMLGPQTRKPVNCPFANGAHEGFGGWTWKSFLIRYDPVEPEAGKTNKT